MEIVKNNAVSKITNQDWHSEADFSNMTARERQDALAYVLTITKDY